MTKKKTKVVITGTPSPEVQKERATQRLRWFSWFSIFVSTLLFLYVVYAAVT